MSELDNRQLGVAGKAKNGERGERKRKPPERGGDSGGGIVGGQRRGKRKGHEEIQSGTDHEGAGEKDIRKAGGERKNTTDLTFRLRETELRKGGGKGTNANKDQRSRGKKNKKKWSCH